MSLCDLLTLKQLSIKYNFMAKLHYLVYDYSDNQHITENKIAKVINISAGNFDVSNQVVLDVSFKESDVQFTKVELMKQGIFTIQLSEPIEVPLMFAQRFMGL